MTHKEAKELEKTLAPCSKCGGELFVSGYSGDGHPQSFEHVTIRCKKCGDWYGGVTHKNKLKED